MTTREKLITGGLLLLFGVVGLLLGSVLRPDPPLPPPPPPEGRCVTVTIKLEEVQEPQAGKPGNAARCKITAPKETDRVVVAPLDVVVWTIENDCQGQREVDIDEFYQGILLDPNDPATCDMSTKVPGCPIESDANHCKARQSVKQKSSADDGKAKIARGVNRSVPPGACYKYSVKIPGHTVDPEFVIF